jgi:hypothetical protein
MAGLVIPCTHCLVRYRHASHVRPRNQQKNPAGTPIVIIQARNCGVHEH